MGVGDLNLLKSWNPNLLKNKKKVWKHEQDLLEEEKKFKQKQLEIAQDRELQEYNDLLLQNKSNDGDNKTKQKPVRRTGLEWMYNDSTNTKPVSSTGSSRTEQNYKNNNPNSSNNDKNHDKDILLGKKSTLAHNYKDPSSRNSSRKTINNNNTTLNKEKNKRDLDRDDPMASFMKAKQNKRANISRDDPMASFVGNNRNSKVHKPSPYKKRY